MTVRRGGLAILALVVIASVGVLLITPRNHYETPPPATPFGWSAITEAVASDTAFDDPFGLAIDTTGNLYVSDAGENNRILKLTPDGIVTTVAAAFNTPSGLAIDEAGTLYVADTGNNAIRKVSADGTVTTLAGDGVAGYRDGPATGARFNGPIGVAIGRNGVVYVADTYNDRIRAISPTGQVSTLAGSGTPGYQDGAPAVARFDTPCALLIKADGTVVVADTVNNAIRTVSPDGQVGTMIRTAPEDHDALFRRPVSLAATKDGFLYVGTRVWGRLFQISPAGEMLGLTGRDIDYQKGDDSALRLTQPNSLAVGPDGALFVADSPTHSLRKIIPRAEHTLPVPVLTSSPSPRQLQPSPWPLGPQYAPHEIVGTMGEVRGNDQGDGRDHFHGGVDVQGAMGAPVLAIAAGKVTDPLTNWGYESLGEGMSIGPISYIHMRVGRTADGTSLAPDQFVAVKDDSGKLRIRVKRGTRFAIGDRLGTVNRMYHVHLEYRPAGANRNPLELGFIGLKDRVAPQISSIRLFDKDGNALTTKRGKNILVPSDAGDISIVVEAFDQIDGDAARRRLGLYRIGYQILLPNGDPIAGYEEPRINLAFDQLPPDQETVKIAYADGSGETVHGSAATHFLYVVTNKVQGGRARAGAWNAGALPRGDYIIRIFASDYAGNTATTGRDLSVTLD